MSSNKWSLIKLGEALDLKSGKSRPKEDGIYPVYGGNGILGYTNRFNAEGENIIIGRVGAYCGATYYEDRKCFISDNALYGKPKKNTNSRFLYYLLKWKNLNQYAGGSSHPLLTQGRLSDLDMSVPDLATQNLIASILSSLDDKIELNLKTNQTLEEIAQALFKEMCMSKNDEVQEAWRHGKLSDFVEINPKLPLKRDSIAKYVEMKDLSEDSAVIKRYVDRPFSSGSRFQNGDTLFARITPCLENGKTGLVDFLPHNEVGWGSTEFIVLRGKKHISRYYVYCLSRLNSFREYAIQSMIGSSGRQRVVDSILAEFDVRIPDDQALGQFDILVRPLFEMIFHNDRENQNLVSLRDSLLPKLMKGEIEL